MHVFMWDQIFCVGCVDVTVHTVITCGISMQAFVTRGFFTCISKWDVFVMLRSITYLFTVIVVFTKLCSCTH